MAQASPRDSNAPCCDGRHASEGIPSGRSYLFEPADPTVRAEDEAVKLAWAMNAVDTYAEASVVAIKMLGEWPKYKYAPSKPVETGP